MERKVFGSFAAAKSRSPNSEGIAASSRLWMRPARACGSRGWTSPHCTSPASSTARRSRAWRAPPYRHARRRPFDHQRIDQVLVLRGHTGCQVAAQRLAMRIEAPRSSPVPRRYFSAAMPSLLHVSPRRLYHSENPTAIVRDEDAVAALHESIMGSSWSRCRCCHGRTGAWHHCSRQRAA